MHDVLRQVATQWASSELAESIWKNLLVLTYKTLAREDEVKRHTMTHHGPHKLEHRILSLAVLVKTPQPTKVDP